MKKGTSRSGLVVSATLYVFGTSMLAAAILLIPFLQGMAQKSACVQPPMTDERLGASFLDVKVARPLAAATEKPGEPSPKGAGPQLASPVFPTIDAKQDSSVPAEPQKGEQAPSATAKPTAESPDGDADANPAETPSKQPSDDPASKSSEKPAAGAPGPVPPGGAAAAIEESNAMSFVVPFRTDEFKPDEEGMRVIMVAASTLQANPTLRGRMTGVAPADRSKRRAKAAARLVRSYITETGIDEKRISTTAKLSEDTEIYTVVIELLEGPG